MVSVSKKLSDLGPGLKLHKCNDIAALRADIGTANWRELAGIG